MAIKYRDREVLTTFILLIENRQLSGLALSFIGKTAFRRLTSELQNHILNLDLYFARQMTELSAKLEEADQTEKAGYKAGNPYLRIKESINRPDILVTYLPDDNCDFEIASTIGRDLEVKLGIPFAVSDSSGQIIQSITHEILGIQFADSTRHGVFIRSFTGVGLIGVTDLQTNEYFWQAGQVTRLIEILQETIDTNRSRFPTYQEIADEINQLTVGKKLTETSISTFVRRNKNKLIALFPELNEFFSRRKPPALIRDTAKRRAQELINQNYDRVSGGRIDWQNVVSILNSEFPDIEMTEDRLSKLYYKWFPQGKKRNQWLPEERQAYMDELARQAELRAAGHTSKWDWETMLAVMRAAGYTARVKFPNTLAFFMKHNYAEVKQYILDKVGIDIDSIGKIDFSIEEVDRIFELRCVQSLRWLEIDRILEDAGFPKRKFREREWYFKHRFDCES